MTKFCQGLNQNRKNFRPQYPEDSHVMVLADNGVGSEGKSNRSAQKRRGGSKSQGKVSITRQRAERLLRTEMGYIFHESFDASGAERKILHCPAPLSDTQLRKPPRDADFYLAHLYEIPLLSREQETYLFRKMNFLKYQADRLRRKLKPARATPRQLDKIEQLQREALETRNKIVESNLRLVFSLAKRYATAGTPVFDEFISDGHLTLMRAVEKFDFSRGVKFSTYATWSVLNGFNAMLKKQGNIQKRHVSDQVEGIADSLADHRVTLSDEKTLQDLRRNVADLLTKLNVPERKIIEARFGFDTDRAPTLRELGEEMGVSKERVRQLQERALNKLQAVADPEGIEFPA